MYRLAQTESLWAYGHERSSPVGQDSHLKGHRYKRRDIETTGRTRWKHNAPQNINFGTRSVKNKSGFLWNKLPTQFISPLIATLKPQSNGPSYSNTVIGTLAVVGWDVTFGTARRGLGGTAARPGPYSLYQM